MRQRLQEVCEFQVAALDAPSAVFSAALNSVERIQTELNAIQFAVFSAALYSVAMAQTELIATIFFAALNSVEPRVCMLPGTGKRGVSDITKNLFVVQTDALRVVGGFNELVANSSRGHAVEERGVGLVPRHCNRLRNGLSCTSGQGLRPQVVFSRAKSASLP
ncbi:hypothetical protein DICSQDRAFT_125764 [Dichomitus squalens LYAD-421 SS1]|uniref:Uncharacterized protein n=1 Tax=Dichomitus squalens (strain LYAD-421) TaxID=732165 RepID=R7SKA4_DICSQ|nr:uncharacterized protein DICSQDRAFT_125764 [Dichomitus squalens LYAD-421 SS1]XP_007371778.1 uncharacterized protein DICSQDRAFT_130590 [Dichomitus squalens LYAD-421 SS1]EJF55482.1 hypothetical protein DICSQDRAFT_130590 [Dichomitus squalens LYAD-421 SS1]EJF63257.1 hypothetical protein DICSQDRAFT_125764 [Dichomitus squalens LYAD-421 SS1]